MEKTKIKKKVTVKAPVVKAAEKNMEKKVVAKADGIAKRTLTGSVVSTSMQKTVVIAIERKVAHKLYGKLIRVTKRIKADTNGLELALGDVVRIQACRPMSKGKSYKVVRKEGSK